MQADDYGRGLPDFTVNLLVRDVARSVAFYRDVFGAKVHHSDADFAALRAGRIEFMVHADHTYEHHPWHAELTGGGRRGLGAELRLFNVDPDELEKRAIASGGANLAAFARQAAWLARCDRRRPRRLCLGRRHSEVKA